MFIIFPHLLKKKLIEPRVAQNFWKTIFHSAFLGDDGKCVTRITFLTDLICFFAGFCSVARRWRHHGVAIATDTYNSHRSAIDTRGFRKEKKKKMKATFLAPSCASRCASSSAAGIPQCEGAVAYHFAIRIRRDVFSRDTTGHKWRKAKFKQLYFPSKLVCCTRCVC